MATNSNTRIPVNAGEEELILAEVFTQMKVPGQAPLLARDMSAKEFVRDVLGEDPWEIQEDILDSVERNGRTVVPKCHSSGGTRVAAQLVIWWLHHWEDGVVYTLAPTWPQVHDLLWSDIEHIRELASQRGVGLGGEFFRASCRWNFGPKRYARGRSTDQPEQLQGPHAGHFLIIIDEASGFPETLEPAVEGMLASGYVRLLLLSQPTKLSGMLWRACNRERGTYKVFTIDGYETPNVQATFKAWREEQLAGGADPAKLPRAVSTRLIPELARWAMEDPDDPDSEERPELVPRPYLLRLKWIAQRLRAWGEKSPFYWVRVRGRFPKQASDSLVSLEWIENAVLAGKTPLLAPGPDEPPLPEVVGCDVARFGTAYTAYSYLRSNRLIRQWRRQGKDLMETAGELKNMYDAALRRGVELTLVVDDTGVGGGVTDRLREQNVPVLAVNFGQEAYEKSDYVDKGSELWGQLGRGFEEANLVLGEECEDLEELEAQLLQPVYTFTSRGKYKVMKLGLDGKEVSPDLGDALALAWEGHLRGSQAVAGGSREDTSLRGTGLLAGNSLPSERRRLWDG